MAKGVGKERLPRKINRASLPEKGGGMDVCSLEDT